MLSGGKGKTCARTGQLRHILPLCVCECPSRMRTCEVAVRAIAAAVKYTVILANEWTGAQTPIRSHEASMRERLRLHIRANGTKRNRVCGKTICPSTLETAHTRASRVRARVRVYAWRCDCAARDIGFRLSFVAMWIEQVGIERKNVPDHCYFYFTLNFYNWKPIDL